MRKQLTKKILVPAELPSSAMGAFFEEQGFELNFKYVEGNEYQFVVNNACPEVLHVPRLKTKPEIDEKFAPLVRSYISEDYVASLQGRKLLAGYFKDGLEFDLIDTYSKDFKNVYTVKIHEYLNVGYFTDAIIVEAYKAKFNINVLRNYLNAALNFAFKKVEISEESMPIDVSYAHNGEAFTVMISMDVDGFEGISEMKESLEVLTANSNFFDITYFHKKNRLTLSSLLFKDKKLAMKSYFFTEIAKKSAQEESAAVTELRSGLEPHDDVKYEAQKIPDEQSKKLALARKFALFIKNYRVTEENPKKLEKLEVSDIEHYLSFYPRQSAVESVDEEIKNFIVKLLKDDQLFDGISDYIKKVASENLDSQVQEIQRVLGGKSLNDIEEIIMIRGSKDEAQDVTRVKGWVEEGSDEKWEVKKGQINEKIQDEVIRINSEGRNVVQDDIIRVVAKELDAKENDIKTVVSGIVEEVVTAEMVNKQKLEEAFALKILATQSGDQVREKLESQIVRMKKIMDGLKKEIVKLQNEKTIKDTGITTPTAEESTPEAQQLRAALLKTMETLKGKEKMLEKVKIDFDQLSKAKDHRIEIMNQKIEELKADFARSREFANEEKLQQLEVENKSLHARLELANKKVNIINENIENRDNEVLGKREKELETLKASMQTAQSVIERFKQDKIEMENRFNEERESNKKLREETKGSTGGISKEELTERDAIISIMNTEKKVMEEKYRNQGMELKKLEQKLKYTISQLETANKKNKAGSAPAAGPKSAEALTKQLDQAKAQLADTTAEMAEKRKEAIKLKQENTALTNKIAELEKKLGIADKKAS